MSYRVPLRIIKIGGSLVGRSDLSTTIRRWLADHLSAEPAINLWVVGGGKLVNVVRDLDAALDLPAEVAHQASIQLMDVNTTIVSSHLSTWPILESLQEIYDRWDGNRALASKSNAAEIACQQTKHQNYLIKTAGILKELETLPLPASIQLPHDWSVSSDSIATWLGVRLDAVEVVLLKSGPIIGDDIESWVEHGLVDDFMREIKQFIKKTIVRCHHLAAKTL